MRTKLDGVLGAFYAEAFCCLRDCIYGSAAADLLILLDVRPWMHHLYRKLSKKALKKLSKENKKAGVWIETGLRVP